MRWIYICYLNKRFYSAMFTLNCLGDLFSRSKIMRGIYFCYLNERLCSITWTFNCLDGFV